MLPVESPGLAAARRKFAAVGAPDDLAEELVSCVLPLRVVRALSDATIAASARGPAALHQWATTQGLDLRELAREDVEAWLSHRYLELREDAEARSSKLSGVRSYYEWRHRSGLGPNIAEGVPLPKRPRHVPRVYSRRQLNAIFAACDRSTLQGVRDYAVLAFALATGCRRMELAALRLADLDIRSERRAAAHLRGKGRRARVVPFAGPAVRALSAWLAMREQVPNADPEAVFLGLRPAPGRPLQARGLDGIVRRAIRLAGVQVSPGMALHSLRATFATNALYSGVPIHELRVLLGHSSLETTSKYLAASMDGRTKPPLPDKLVGELLGERPIDLPLWARRRLQGADVDPD